MRFQWKTWMFAAALCCVIGAFASISTPAQIGRTGDPAKIIQVPGVMNAASITDEPLSPKRNPLLTDMQGLRKLGVDIVVDFRDETAEIKFDKKMVESQGMKFVSVPWKGDSLPTHDELITFFKLLHDNPDKKIFIHCEYGKDRTGVMSAIYRIAVEHWSADQSIAEMREFHYNSARLPHLARYVRAFPAMLDADTSLARVIPAPRTAVQSAQPGKQADGAHDPMNH